MGNKIVNLDVMSLLVNVENPRFLAVNNQRQAIQYMVDDQGEKLIGLAQDIISFGLNPADPILIVKHLN